MTALSSNEAIFLGTVLEGIFYGIYCVIFALFLNIQKKSSGSNRLTHALIFLFVLCTGYICLDFTQQFITIFRLNGPTAANVVQNINITTSMIYTFTDITTQSILIYRCWIMWNRNPLFIIFPTVLALASFSTCLGLTIELIRIGLAGQPPVWFFPLGVASFSISAFVNFVVSGLLVLRLVLTHYELKREGTLDYSQALLPLITILVESGIFTFVGQIVWTVLFGLQNTGFNSINGPITMIYGITPTVILVRVAMGTSLGERTKHMTSTIRFNDVKSFPATSMTTGGMSDTTNKTLNNESTSNFMDTYNRGVAA